MKGKRKRLILDICLILVGIFFAYKVFSTIKFHQEEKKSIEIYETLEEKSFSRKEGESAKRDFSQMKALNPDFLAWMIGQEGRINYPLVQGKDNEKYLSTAANGEKNALGSIFMDYRNKSLEDPFILIYGHMMKDDRMFGSLKDLKTQDAQPGTFSLDTGEKIYETQTVLTGLVSGETKIDPEEFTSYPRRQEFYQKIRKDALYDSGYELQEEDRLVVLVTCSYEARNLRLLVVTLVKK